MTRGGLFFPAWGDNMVDYQNGQTQVFAPQWALP